MTRRRRLGRKKYYENKLKELKKRRSRGQRDYEKNLQQHHQQVRQHHQHATRLERTYDRENPPRPSRTPPIPARDRVPATPGALPEVPRLSPRLQLKAENFKNTRGKTDDSYYEKKLFDEIRQRSYILQHPTSQHYNSSPEIKRVYEGFVTEDY
eukprot:6462431-Amphidinium_carterae.1